MGSQPQDGAGKAAKDRDGSRASSGKAPKAAGDLAGILDSLSLSSQPATPHAAKPRPPAKPMPNPFASNHSYDQRSPVKIVDGEALSTAKPPSKPPSKPPTKPAPNAASAAAPAAVKAQAAKSEAKPLVKPGATPLVKPGSAPLAKPGATPLVKPGATPLAKPGSAPLAKPGATPLVKPGAAKPLAKPMPNPFAKNAAMDPFGTSASGGKFANSATTEADVGESDAHVRHVQASGVHHKPRFKQVVRGAKPPAAPEGGESQERLKALLNYASDEADDESDDEKSADLKIDGLLPRLLPHQVRGVRFMARRERGRKYVRGGLLADDMGLGKTIQSIALILYHPPDGPDAPQTTLVVTPLAVMDQWKDEISQMAPRLRVGTHQGTNRTKDASDWDRYDVLVTTYDVVSREHQRAGPLFQRAWHRIVADEAHSFRGPTTKICAAMGDLRSDGRRWALTGTPLHNKLVDLFPLFRFIGVPHSSTVFDFEKTYTGDESLEALKKQLRVIMLRRTTRVLQAFLPSLTMHATKTRMTPMELAVYHSCQPSRTSLHAGSKLTTLVRMRQACDGLLSPAGNVALGWADDADADAEAGIDVKAAAPASAPEPGTDALKTGAVDEERDLADMLNMLSIKPKAAEKKAVFPGHRNSKVQEVRGILVKERTRKTVLFSSFVTMLVALRPMLEFEGIKYLQYDGSLTADQRRDMLAKFRDEKLDYVVLLCSLQTASVGLNLTSASQVIMVDPWWNPQIVDQAIKRVHRLGQVRAVDCYQLFAGDALDERMMHIQDKKRKLAAHLIDGSADLSDTDKEYLLYGAEGEADAADKPAPRKAGAAHRHGSDSERPAERHRTGPAAVRVPDTGAHDDDAAVKADLPWASQRSLPKIPKHKKASA